MKNLLQEMAASLSWWLLTEYKRQYPKLATDAPPLSGYTPYEMTSSNPPRSVYSSVKARFDAEQKRWQKKINEGAGRFGSRFAEKTRKETQEGLNDAFKRAGLAIVAKNSRRINTLFYLQRDNIVASVQYVLTDFLNGVMADALKGLTEGRDPNSLKQQIKDRLSRSQRRAGNASRDLAANTVNLLTRGYNEDLGLNTAIWVHVPGKKYSRRTHERMNGKEFDLRKGMWDPEVKQWIQPSQLPYCMCTYRLKVPEWLEDGKN